MRVRLVESVGLAWDSGDCTLRKQYVFTGHRSVVKRHPPLFRGRPLLS